MKTLKVGDKLPNFECINENEEIVNSGNSVKNKVINEKKVKTKNLPNYIYYW